MTASKRRMRVFKKIRNKLKKLNPARQEALRHRRAGNREIVDRLKEIVVGDLLLKVDEFEGEFYLDPRSDLSSRIILDGAYEPTLVEWTLASADENLDIIDVGANVGFYAVLLAKHTAPQRTVVAFEPCEGAYRRLEKNISHNAVGDKVRLIPKAASSSEGTSYIHELEGRSEYSSLSPLIHPSTAHGRKLIHTIQTTTVDKVVADHLLSPGFIKIDVEGGEYLVLEGSMKTLAQCRPIILLELSDQLLRAAGSSADQLLTTMKRIDYLIVDPVKPGLPPGSRDFGEVFCYPKERFMHLPEIIKSRLP